MKITSAEFVKSATAPSQYPPPELPEIAFAGRSNVGKSSLINTLVNRKHLARTSSSPGRTQLINFYRINQRLMFVDIPGYGYAKVPEAVRRRWAPMIETYITTRSVLAGLVVILDIRRDPKVEETALAAWLRQHHISTVWVLTKIDKLSKMHRAVRQQKIADQLSTASDSLALFSARTRQGREAVWEAIGRLVPDVFTAAGV
ncbi:MAG TPA: ribosome biogenesis GTP-binding protein YihA/YsxC [Desulfobacterales bacterium]